MPKAIITGASGFIGRHLVNKLKENNQVITISHKPLLFNKVILLPSEIDYIFHLAGYGNHYNQNDEPMIIGANIDLLYKTLFSTDQFDYKAFINFSTSSVTLPVQTLYSITKKAGEDICKYYAKKYDKPIVSIRPYSVYGSGEADFRFIPTLILNGLKGNKSKVVFEPRHDWVYVEDLVDALMLIVKNIDSLRGQVIPIGTGLSWSNEEVAQIIDEIFQKENTDYKNIFYDRAKDMREYDNKEWVADNTILRNLGWCPKHSLREGLVETFKYYDRLRKENT